MRSYLTSSSFRLVQSLLKSKLNDYYPSPPSPIFEGSDLTCSVNQAPFFYILCKLSRHKDHRQMVLSLHWDSRSLTHSLFPVSLRGSHDSSPSIPIAPARRDRGMYRDWLKSPLGAGGESHNVGKRLEPVESQEDFWEKASLKSACCSTRFEAGVVSKKWLSHCPWIGWMIKYSPEPVWL